MALKLYNTTPKAEFLIRIIHIGVDGLFRFAHAPGKIDNNRIILRRLRIRNDHGRFDYCFVSHYYLISRIIVRQD
jgi:hypothetical protein